MGNPSTIEGQANRVPAGPHSYPAHAHRRIARTAAQASPHTNEELSCYQTKSDCSNSSRTRSDRFSSSLPVKPTPKMSLVNVSFRRFIRPLGKQVWKVA